MKRSIGGAAILVVAVSLIPAQIAAQQGQRGGRGGPPQQAGRMGPAQGQRMMGRAPGGPGMGAGVEGIMRMRERLNLTDDQFKRLDAIRAETVTRRVEHQAEVAELRSRVLAGELDRAALRDSVNARRGGASAMQEAQRARVEAILTTAQTDTLKTLVGRRRAFAAGRASAMREMRRGMRGGGQGFMPGGQPGFRGQRGGGGGMMPARMMRPGRGGRMGGMGFGPLPVQPDSGRAGGGR
jgi:hypothetical protein